MDYPTLRNLHPTTLLDTADHYQSLAMQFDQTAATWDGQVVQATQKAWTGSAADTAVISLQTSSTRLHNASSLLQQSSRQLSDTAQQFITLQGQLQQVNDMALQNGLVIHDDGSISTNPQSPQLPTDPTVQMVAMTEVSARLDDTLKRATEVDNQSSIDLGQTSQSVEVNVTSTPGAPHPPTGQPDIPQPGSSWRMGPQ
jgi:hypothetical protein